jgi:hypothetical protein
MSAPKTETESFGAPKQRSTPKHYPSITTCPLNKITPKQDFPSQKKDNMKPPREKWSKEV